MAQSDWPKATFHSQNKILTPTQSSHMCPHSSHHVYLFSSCWCGARQDKHTETHSVKVLCVIIERGCYFNLQPPVCFLFWGQREENGLWVNSSLNQTPHLTLSRTRRSRHTYAGARTHKFNHYFIIIQVFRHKNFKKSVLRQCRVRMNKTCVQKGKNSWITVLLMLLSNYCSGTEVALWIISLMWSHLVSSMGPALCERCGGAKLDGLWLVKDHRGQRLLSQRQHV